MRCPRKVAATAALLGFGLTMSAYAQGIASGSAPAAARPRLSGLPFRASFVDVAYEAGVRARAVQGDPKKKKYIIEANGTGIGFIDYNNDGRLDIFLVNGSRLASFPAGQEPTNHLYRNDGSGKFTDVTKEAGVGRSGWGNGVCRGDVDNDGNEDLYVTYWGFNSLYRNRSDGRFEDIAAAVGVAGQKNTWSTGCTFVDYDRDGRLDLLVSSYVGFQLDKAPLPGQLPFCLFKDQPVYCGPRGMPYGSLTLYHQREDGKFDDVSMPSGIRKAPDFYAFTTIAADLNHDGWVDLYVACDSTPGLFFRNSRDGTFVELATEAGVAYNEHGTEQAGMGIAVRDYNNDGSLDITKTNFIRDYPNLYRNSGQGFFDDVAVASGLGVNPQYVLWGTGLEDFDNDGWADLFQVAGHVYPEREAIDPVENYRNPRLVYRNLGNGKFEDVSGLAGSGVTSKHASRGAAFGDFDNDGDVDVLVMNMDEPPSLLRNELTGENRWIKLKLQGTKSNRSAIGSTVTINAGGVKQSAAVVSQSSFLSANDARLHFGLGRAEGVETIVVHWASGAVEEFRNSSVNSLVLLAEGSGRPKPLPLPR